MTIQSTPASNHPYLSAAGVATAATAVATLIGYATLHSLPKANVALIFIVAVLICAISSGLWTGIIAALLSSLALNYFFIKPRYTFAVADPEELVALVAFLIVAVLTGALAGRMREEADAARRRAKTVEMLYELSGQLAATLSTEELTHAIVMQAAAAIRGSAVLLQPKGEALEVVAAAPTPVSLEFAEMAAARLCHRSRETLSAVASGWPGSRFEFRPLAAARGLVGVIGLAPDEARVIDDADEQGLQSLLQQGAAALERSALFAERQHARAVADQEKLRSALLSSISHDLRTPLAAVLGSVTSLRQLGASMPAETRDDLLAAIEEETSRLSRFVTNLLDMTKLESGVEVKRELVDVGEVVEAVIQRTRRVFPQASIDLRLEEDVPPVRSDAALLGQVVFNLLDNAVRFSPSGEPIMVSLMRIPDGIELSVVDRGPGIAPDVLPHIFEKFYRAPESTAYGAGLGLSICQRVVEAMGGRIQAASPLQAGKGAKMIVTLPVEVTAKRAQ